METDHEQEVVGSGDVFARCVLYPKNVKDGENLSPEILFDVTSLGNKNRSDYASSLALMSLLGGTEGVHGYGCRTAENANRRLASKPIFAAQNFDRVRHGYAYLGFYTLSGSSAREVTSSFYDLRILQKEEENEAAHYNLTMICKSDLPPDMPNFKLRSRADRTAIIAQLFAKLSGPERFVCEIDNDRREILLSIPLEKLPRTTNKS